MGKNSLMALLAAFIAELGIRHTKRPSSLGKTLWILSFLEGSIHLNILEVPFFAGGYEHSESARAW